MTIQAVIGGQWGDEGKGKIVDLLSKDVNIVARYQGGANAGHTVYKNNKKIVLHQIPTGILREKCQCVLGKGMVIDPIGIIDEMNILNDNNVNFEGRILIDYYAHIVTPIHKLIDKTNEIRSGNKIGTTCKGIGPTYGDKYQRIGIRAIDLLDINSLEDKINHRLSIAIANNEIEASDKADLIKEIKQFYLAAEKVSSLVVDAFTIIHSSNNYNMLIEGAQGTMLDIDHGTFPYVTSSNCSSGGIGTGLGIPVTKINSIMGIFKAYTTRVGGGPFPTELFDEDGKQLGEIGKEFGATTGRPRRCGWFDLLAAKYSVTINGLTEIALTKLDILNTFSEIKVCTGYQVNGKKVKNLSQVLYDLSNVKPVYQVFKGWHTALDDIQSFQELPEEAKAYISFLENELGVPITIISIGPKRKQILINKK